MFQIFALIFAIPAAAQDDGWDSFTVRCQTELHEEWLPTITKGKEWTQHSLENLRNLRDMSQKICPAYLAKRNDGTAIQAFVASKKRILDESPVVDKDGKALLEFLRVQFEDHKTAFLPAEIDFGGTRCGMHLLATSKTMKARLQEIQNSVKELTTKCFQVNAQEERAAQDKNLQKADHQEGRAQGAPAKTGPGSKQGSSDITGVPEATAKDKKLPQ